MRKPFLALATLLALNGCQAIAPRPRQTSAAVPGTPAALAGEYDNHAEVWTAAEAAKTQSGTPLPPAVHHYLRTVPGLDDGVLWRIAFTREPTQEARWLLRESGDGYALYRPLTTAAEASFGAPADKRFDFVATDWAELSACALHRDAQDGYASDAGCAALLPGLGAGAALLPLRFSLSGDALRVVTVTDQARGAGASTLAHRVRWFGGWAAINGQGPKATDGNDWHLRRDLRLHSEGSRLPLRWRDGAESGYSLELARLDYRESNTEVLRLAVIDDTSGHTLSYVWANPEATRIGLNLGWLQVGLDIETVPRP